MDRQPKLPIGGTAGTGNFEVLVGRGAMAHRKTCSCCGTKFSVPADAFAKVSEPLYKAGTEMPCVWCAQTKQTRLNGVSEYKTPRPCTQFEAASYFDKVLGITALVTRMFRKVPLTDEQFDKCRTCYRQNLTAKAQSWRAEKIIVKDKRGNVKAVHMPNKGKELPDRFAGAKLPVEKPVHEVKGTRKKTVKTEETPVLWRCSTPSTKREVSYTVTVPQPMLLKDAKAYFRNILSRESLNGCSVYW